MSEKKKPNNSISDRVKINKIYYYNVVTLKDNPVKKEADVSKFDSLYTRFIVTVPYKVDSVDSFKKFISDWYASPSSEGNHDIIAWNLIDEEIIAILDKNQILAVAKL